MAAIRLERVSKVFSPERLAVTGLSLDVADGEFVVLVGPSGCGKTTTLRLLAGLESPSSGRVFIDGRDVTAAPPQRRDLAMVFQNSALYPHKTVRQNLEFALRLRGDRRPVMDERVAHAARVLGLEELLERRPGELSGGERQRLALGRALVRQPKAFLLDEPLSNLDAGLRLQMRTQLSHLRRELGTTIIYVTHDQEEAMTLADRVVVMRGGAIQQCGPPMEVYRRPANVFVARFIGAPSMNFFPCRVEGAALCSAHFSIPLDDHGLAHGRRLLLGVRPKAIELAGKGDLAARVEAVQPLGSEMLLELRAAKDPAAGSGSPLITVVVPAEAVVRLGEQVSLRLRRDQLHLFDADTEERIG